MYMYGSKKYWRILIWQLQRQTMKLPILIFSYMYMYMYNILDKGKAYDKANS